MKFKKILLVMLVVVLLFTVLNSVNAFVIQKTDSRNVYYSGGNSLITVNIVSNNVASNHKMANDLNRINKVVVKVDGKTVNKVYKGKSWNRYNYYPSSILFRKEIKGNIKGKKVSILTFDKNNNLLKSKINTVKYVSTMLTSKKQAQKAAQKYINTSTSKIGNATLNKYGVWFVEYLDKKTGKKLGEILIDDKTGDMGYG
ncbi:MAG: hypothetical protein FWH54_03705 [Methanobrevibacter sp.]|nr:hypothetical protein [Methanobrevibacter sp.]